MNSEEFKGKVAIVTGAGGGIGKYVAKEWAGQGGLAVVTDVEEHLARAVASEINSEGGGACAMRLNVRNRDEWRDTVDTVAKREGRIDALFNVAGINVFKGIDELEEEDWNAVFETNLMSMYRGCKLVIPVMRGGGGGAIVNIASVNGILAGNRIGAYSASKGGVIMLTRNLAMDFAKDNIRANCICPGSTRTPRTESYWKNSPTGTSEIAVRSPMKRPAEPVEIARPAVFLASSGASYMTGAVVVVDGGLSAGLVVPTFDRM